MDVEAKLGEENVVINLYPDVGEESIQGPPANADVSNPNAPKVGRDEHRRDGALMVNSTPNVRFPCSRGVTTLNWFDAAFRIDRIGCP